MTLLADANLVVNQAVLTAMDDKKLEMLSNLVGNEIFIEFCEKNKEATWAMAVELDPLSLADGQGKDYLDTMKHLRRVANMWDQLHMFATQSKAAILTQAANSPGNIQ